jgi:hypothetical protein
MPMYLVLSCGASMGKTGGGDLGSDIPVLCCERGGWMPSIVGKGPAGNPTSSVNECQLYG